MEYICELCVEEYYRIISIATESRKSAAAVCQIAGMIVGPPSTDGDNLWLDNLIGGFYIQKDDTLQTAADAFSHKPHRGIVLEITSALLSIVGGHFWILSGCKITTII